MRTYDDRKVKEAYKQELVMMLNDLLPGERGRKIKELAEMEHIIPGYGIKRYSRSTIYNWIKKRQDLPCDGVVLPKIRSDYGQFRHITVAQEKAIIRWRQKNMDRSIKVLQEELLVHEKTKNPPLSESTISRFLRSVDLDRRSMALQEDQAKIRLAYDVEYPQRMWLADTKGPHLYVNSGTLAKLIIFIDSKSRYITAYAYVITENEQDIISVFIYGITRYGVPDILYVDQGSPYKGNRLQTAATLIGCRVQHTPVSDAAAKGKVERVLQTFYRQLESELKLFNGDITLEQANEYLSAYIHTEYHKNVHSVTGETPLECYSRFPQKYRRFISDKAISLIFLPVARSKVNKTGLITINKRKYLVPSAKLYSSWVEVRYDIYDPQRVHVWAEHTYYGEAREFEPGNDYQARQKQLSDLIGEPAPQMELGSAPPYTKLERMLAAYKMEVSEDVDLNDELTTNFQKRENVKTTLFKEDIPVNNKEDFNFLLSALLNKNFNSNEKLMIKTAWEKYGPFDEKKVRSAVGNLLGQQHPVSELAAYLEEIKLMTAYSEDNSKKEVE